MGESHRPHPTQTYAKRLERSERDREIMRLKRAGLSTFEVAEAVGCSPTTVTKVHKDSIREVAAEKFTDTEMYVAESLDRLGALLAAIMPTALAGSVKCVTECRLLIAEMATYTGAKAPIRHEWGESDVDRAIRELGEVLNRRADQTSGEAAHSADAAD